MKKLFIYIIILISAESFAATDEFGQQEEVRFRDTAYHTTFYLTIGGAVHAGGSDFFDIYNNFLGAKESYFSKTPLYGAGFKVFLMDRLRLDVSVNYMFSEIYEYYTQILDTIQEGKSRTIEQSINMKDMPVLFGLEYIPIEGPYRTFLGFKAGINVGHFNWKENISSQLPYDDRTGGKYGWGEKILPVFRFNTGVELAFDVKHPEYILNRLLMEISYTFIYRKEHVFSKLQDQYRENISRFNKKYFIAPSMLEFKVGVSLDFSRLEN